MIAPAATAAGHYGFTGMEEMEKIISDAVEVLRNGGTILYPTDTVWGLGCDATNPDAVSEIYRIKRRSDSKAEDAPTALSSWGTSPRAAERINAKVRERPDLSFLCESLILAQDERWRRA